MHPAKLANGRWIVSKRDGSNASPTGQTFPTKAGAAQAIDSRGAPPCPPAANVTRSPATSGPRNTAPASCGRARAKEATVAHPAT